MKPLEGKVALVAGATRGAGRGIAVALGEAGATVYGSGRSAAGHAATPGRPETLEGTAALVTEVGGKGIAHRADHLVEADVAALVDRIRREQGRLDVLVNDVWGGDALTEWGTPFWELDVAKGFRMMETAIHTHIVTARHAVPLMLATAAAGSGGGDGAPRGGGRASGVGDRAPGPGPGPGPGSGPGPGPGSGSGSNARRAGTPLLVEVTDGNAGWYRGTLFYDLVKSTLVRLAFAMGEELRGKGVTALAVTPGFLRSEAVLDHFGVTEATWRDGAKQDPHFAHSETPRFVGRAVAALAADPNVATKAGRVWASWDLAKEYGFTDADGRTPDWGAHWAEAFPDAGPTLDEGYYAYWRGWDAVARRL